MEQLDNRPTSKFMYSANNPDLNNRHNTSTQQIIIEHAYYVPGTKLGSDITPELPFKISKARLHTQSNLIFIKQSDISYYYPHFEEQ